MIKPISQQQIQNINNPNAQAFAGLNQTLQNFAQGNRQSRLDKMAEQQFKSQYMKENAPFIAEVINQATPDEAGLEFVKSKLNPIVGNDFDLDDLTVDREKVLTSLSAFVQQNNIASNTKAFAPVTIINQETGEKKLVTPTFNKQTGKGELSPLDIPEGFVISKETGAEKRTADVQAKIKTKRGEATAKSQAERRETQINQGLDAADGFANIERALTLLDDVETGGTDNLSLKAKQFFGVEGANEAELSNRMGKAVLSQLRATFGAAFTAAEGKQLSNIEAGFGKSTAGNRRLLEQTKRIVLRAARRGIRAAKATGDLDTVADIEESLAFRLDDEPQSVLPNGITEDDITETMKANNMTREQVLQRLQQ